MLTDDCLALVHMFLPFYDRVNFVLTCRRFRDAIDTCGLPHDYQTWLKQQPADYVEELPVQITVYGARMSHMPLTCLVNERRSLTIMHNFKRRVVDTRKLRVYDGCFTKTKPINIKLETLRGWLEIGDDFLLACPLSTLDMQPLSSIMRIGSQFLRDSSLLTSIDLSPLRRLTKIGHNFLAGCSGLVSIDLTPLSNVKSVGSGFLCRTGIVHLDTTPLIGARVSTAHFLSCCHALRTVNLACFRGTTSIEIGFMYSCVALESVDLSMFINVTDIDMRFMTACASLESIKMPPMRHLNRICCDFLAHCTNLRTVSFDGFTNVTYIDDGFMQFCTSLERIDLSMMSKIEHFGDGFLGQCTNLRQVRLHRAFDDYLSECIESDDDYMLQIEESFMLECPVKPSFHA